MSNHFSMGAINKITNKYEYPKIANKINKYKCPFCEKDVIFRVYIHYKTFFLHRLVAFTFIPNSTNKEQVNHKDGNKTNKCVDNLEWVTNKENQLHKFQNGLGNNQTRKIGKYDLNNNFIIDYKSLV